MYILFDSKTEMVYKRNKMNVSLENKIKGWII